MIVDGVLGLEAQAAAEGQIGADAPVVLEEQSRVDDGDDHVGTAGSVAELAGPSSGGGDLSGSLPKDDPLLVDLVRGERGEGVRAVVVGGGTVGVAGGAETSAVVEEVFSRRFGDVVLELEAVLVVVVGAAIVAPAGKGTLHDDAGCV